MTVSLRRRLSSDHGFTMIELLVAIVLLAIGVIAVITTFDSARGLATSSEMRDTADAIARGEIGRIEALPWSSIALASNPTQNSGAGPTDPTYYISTPSGGCWSGSTPPVTGTYECYQWNWSSSSSAEPLVINSGTTDTTTNPYTLTDSVSTSNGSTRVSFSVYRFITYVNDSECTASDCSTNYYKRITVAVTSTRLSQPVEITTLYFNPVGGANDPLGVTGVECLDGTSTVSCTD